MPIASAYSESTAKILNGHLSPELNPCEMREGEFKFFINEARKSGGPVLELASGAGRMLMVLVKVGIEIYGLEASWPMIEWARKAIKKNLLKNQQKRIHLIQGDVRHFHFRRPFSLVIIPYHSFWFNLLPDRSPNFSVEGAGQAELCIESIIRALKPKGKFIIDFPGNYTEPLFLRWWASMAEKYKFKFRIIEPYRYQGYYKALIGQKL